MRRRGWFHAGLQRAQGHQANDVHLVVRRPQARCGSTTVLKALRQLRVPRHVQHVNDVRAPRPVLLVVQHVEPHGVVVVVQQRGYPCDGMVDGFVNAWRLVMELPHGVGAQTRFHGPALFVPQVHSTHALLHELTGCRVCHVRVVALVLCAAQEHGAAGAAAHHQDQLATGLVHHDGHHACTVNADLRVWGRVLSRARHAQSHVARAAQLEMCCAWLEHHVLVRRHLVSCSAQGRTPHKQTNTIM